MQENVSIQKIREKLDFLRLRLPEQPTAVSGLYSLPSEFVKKVKTTNFSQSSVQEISDHIGYYLGLLNKVKVTIGVESSEYMLGTASDIEKADQVGLYKVIGGYSREVQLTKKFKFQLKHILAILAHESIHHYLFQHEVVEPEEAENEILTDIATAYLGLGHVLIPGYEPITWTSNHWDYVIASGHTTHSMYIGYVTADSIRRAIIMSAELRGWNPREVVAGFSTGRYKLVAYLQLFPYRRKLREIEKEKKRETVVTRRKDEQVYSLRMELERIRKNYDNVCELMKGISITADLSSITTEDGRMIVEITNKISIGETANEIERLSARIRNLDGLSGKGETISQLAKRIADLNGIISKWNKLLSKYRNK